MMLRINFKNVGQGDTIFLQWKDHPRGKKKFGLIDCNLADDGIFQVIDHIETRLIKTFEFVVFTHPHSDHFSGFPDFFEYCELNGIIIKDFYFTSDFSHERLQQIFNKSFELTEYDEIMAAPVNVTIHKERLLKVFYKLDEQAEKNGKGFIQNVNLVTGDKIIDLGASMRMRFLSPQLQERTRFLSETFDKKTGKNMTIRPTEENNPNANYLCTLIQIYNDAENWQLFLCSDVTKFTLRRILENVVNFKKLTSRKLLAIQIPHHGSFANHHEKFWKSFKNLKKAESVISVGLGYSHPSGDVVKFFENNCNSVHATNNVGGYSETPIKKIGLDAAFSLPGLEVLPQKELIKNRNRPPCGEKEFVVDMVDGRLDYRMK